MDLTLKWLRAEFEFFSIRSREGPSLLCALTPLPQVCAVHLHPISCAWCQLLPRGGTEA